MEQAKKRNINLPSVLRISNEESSLENNSSFPRSYSIIGNKHRNKDYCYFTKILWLGMGNEDDYKITT